MIKGILLTLLLEAIFLVGYNVYIYRRVLELNHGIKRLVMHCCAKRVKDYNWPMDKKILRKAEKMFEFGSKYVCRRLLADETLKLLDEAKLGLSTMKGF